MALIFGVCAWRLTGAPAHRNERLLVSLLLGLGLLASSVMRRTLLPTRFDELDHVTTLSHLISSHALFPVNTYLPVSPYYAGLELATLATRWLMGLPLTADEWIVLTAVRVLLVLAVFLVLERACKSSRAGGVGALVYMSNPQSYGFDSQYSYETMALALAAAAVYLLFVSVDRARPGTGRLYALALCSIAAVVVAHHLTGWLTVASSSYGRSGSLSTPDSARTAQSPRADLPQATRQVPCSMPRQRKRHGSGGVRRPASSGSLPP
jgi:hypothetical protein